MNEAPSHIDEYALGRVGNKNASALARAGYEVCALTKLQDGQDEGVLAEYGCRLITQIGDIFIANIPISSLRAMAADDRVVRIESHKGGKVMMDEAHGWVDTAPVYSGTELPQAYHGENVLVGIIDIGFDLTHPNFYSSDGSRYRIKRFVDQFGTDDEPFGHPIPLGREYSTEEEILGKQHSVDAIEQYHGTHCLGISAGSGLGTAYQGIASEADICAVSTYVGAESFWSASEVACMKYIFDYADEIGKPCVISYSISYDYLPADAVLYEEAINQLTGPGHIIVACAGNSNRDPTYLEKKSGEETAGTTLLNNSRNRVAYLISPTPFKLRCIALEAEEANGTTTYIKKDSLELDTELLSDTTQTTLGNHNITFIRRDSLYTLTDHLDMEWMVDNDRLALLVEGEEAHVRMYTDLFTWFSNALSDTDPRFGNAEHSHSIYMPACMSSIITVGALNTRATYININGTRMTNGGLESELGTIASFSSIGPTMDGEIKPDLVAPGVSIHSSGNSFYPSGRSWTNKTVAITSFNNRDYPWVALSGTSMSCPLAAGIIALWLEASPSLSPDEVKEVLASTSTKVSEEEMDYPNNTYGHGIIDAYAGMLHILGIDTAIDGISTHRPTGLTISPLQDGALRLSFEDATSKPLTIRVFNISGQLLFSQELPPTFTRTHVVQVQSAPRGTYVVQVDSEEPRFRGSELVRW